MTKVIKVLRHNPYISETIVVDDGPFNNTSKIAKSVGARIIRLAKNQGKAQAMARGVKVTDASIIFL
ncbi:glycosyltransferase [bacterium]|nr:glycosyltransferase [bacterium]